MMKLVPNKPTFATDMTADERKIMLAHRDYLTEQMNNGLVLVFGPVLDPAGVYGAGVLAVDNEEQVKELIKNDPAAAINRYEYYPMLAVVPAK